MTQAIVVRFHGPTDKRGSRYSARCEAGRVTVEADDRLGIDANRNEACRKLARRLGWFGTWASGSLPDGACVYVYVGKGNSLDLPLCIEVEP